MKCPLCGLPARRFIVALLFAAMPVLASEHGESGSAPARPEPMIFTVNVGDAIEGTRYLQVSMEFDFANPEVTQRLAAIKPKVQHRIILLLCDEDAGKLRTAQGKQSLQESILKTINDLLGESARNGVRDVFFTNFIIQ